MRKEHWRHRCKSGAEPTLCLPCFLFTPSHPLTHNYLPWFIHQMLFPAAISCGTSGTNKKNKGGWGGCFKHGFFTSVILRSLNSRDDKHGVSHQVLKAFSQLYMIFCFSQILIQDHLHRLWWKSLEERQVGEASPLKHWKPLAFACRWHPLGSQIRCREQTQGSRAEKPLFIAGKEQQGREGNRNTSKKRRDQAESEAGPVGPLRCSQGAF